MSDHHQPAPATWPTAHQAILAGQSPAIPGPAPTDENDESPAIVDAQIHTGIAIIDGIKALRAQAAAERVAMHERGEPLTDYSAGVLAGLDRAWLTAFRVARKPEDTRETTSPEEWWACERAFLAGREDALVNPPGTSTGGDPS